MSRSHELSKLVQAVRERELSATTAANQAVQLGYMLVGTVVSKPLHYPVESRYFSLSINAWTLIGNRDENGGQRFLMATDIGAAAVACAFFGDYNDLSDKGQRAAIDAPLTTEPRPHFGFSEDSDYPGKLCVEALPELAHAARMPRRLQGWIDCVPSIGFTRYEDLGPGQYISEGYHTPGAPYPTENSIPVVSGRDAPQIRAIERARSIFDPPV